jgi:hypothetical protein
MVFLIQTTEVQPNETPYPDEVVDPKIRVFSDPVKGLAILKRELETEGYEWQKYNVEELTHSMIKQAPFTLEVSHATISSLKRVLVITPATVE